MVSGLELEIAWRYLRSRGRTRWLSFISVIAIGGIVVGVSALILIIGVMNGLQTDLREKILVGSPDFRVLTYGDDLKLPNWREIQKKVATFDGVTAVSSFLREKTRSTSSGRWKPSAMMDAARRSSASWL